MSKTFENGDKVFMTNSDEVIGVLPANGDLTISNKPEHNANTMILIALFGGLVYIETTEFKGFYGWTSGKTTFINSTMKVTEVQR